VSETDINRQVPSDIRGEPPGTEVVDADESDMAFAVGDAQVRSQAAFDDARIEAGGRECAGNEPGLADVRGASRGEDAGAVISGNGAVGVLEDELDVLWSAVGQAGDYPGERLAEVSEADKPPCDGGVRERRAEVAGVTPGVPEVQGDVPIAGSARMTPSRSTGSGQHTRTVPLHVSGGPHLPLCSGRRDGRFTVKRS
jgi:hypothetical protein